MPYGSQKSRRKQLQTVVEAGRASPGRRPNLRRKMQSFGAQLGSVKAARLSLSVLSLTVWEELVFLVECKRRRFALSGRTRMKHDETKISTLNSWICYS